MTEVPGAEAAKADERIVEPAKTDEQTVGEATADEQVVDEVKADVQAHASWAVGEWLGKPIVDCDGERIGKLRDVYVDV
ncbi:MAG TPA: PRC-barrel domain-containing protein, partial [Candidatus Nanopelagicales bacterium]